MEDHEEDNHISLLETADDYLKDPSFKADYLRLFFESENEKQVSN